MDLQEINVFIDKDGKVRIEVRGVKGKACLDITQALEAALGRQIEQRELTPEADDETQNPLDQRLQDRAG